MNFNEITPELKAKVLACKTPEELLALAKEEGYELSDSELEAVSGGVKWSCTDFICTKHSCEQDWWC